MMPALLRQPRFLALPALCAGLLCLLPVTRAAEDSPAALIPDANLVIGTLTNGVRYAILPNAKPEHRVSLRLLIRAGSLMETDPEQGLAHFLEHMAFNGSTHYPPGSLVEIFQKMGMKFGDDSNAATGFDQTVYQLDLPTGAPEQVREGLQMLRDYAGNLLIRKEEVDHERGVILAEKRSRDSVDFRTSQHNFRFLFPDALVPRRFPIGTEETVGAAGRDDLLAFYEHWYRPERMTVIAVGEVDPNTVQNWISAAFADFTAKRNAVEPPPLGRVTDSGLRFDVHREAEAAEVRVTAQSQQAFEPRADSIETRTRQWMQDAAVQALSLRLQALARQPGAPFLAAGAYHYDQFEFVSMAGITLVCRPGQWEAALKTEEQELRRALDFGFRDYEVTAIRAEMLNRAREAVARADARLSESLAAGLVHALAHDRVFTRPETDLRWIEPALQAMTAESLHDALRAMWKGGRTVFVSGPIDTDAAHIEALWTESNHTAVQPPPERAATDFAYTDFGPAGTIAEQTAVKDLDATQIRFANGARLNLKKTDFSPGSLLFLLRVGHGRLVEPPEEPGLSLVAGDYLYEAALGRHSREDLDLILAGHSVEEKIEIGTDALTFSGSTRQEDLPLQLALLAAYLTDPGRRADALDRVRASLVDADNEARRTAMGVMRNQIQQTLAGGDGRFGRPALAVLESYSLDQILAWLEPMLREGRLELTLVGDLDPEAAIAAVSRTIGALPARADQPDPLASRRRLHPLAGPVDQTVLFDSRIPNALVALYWSAPDLWDIQRTRRLQMLASIFNDRLRVRIREAMGDTYSPFAGFNPSDTFTDYGWILSVSTVDPDRAEAVIAEIVKIASDMATRPLNPDEIERARKPALASLNDTVRKNSYWLHSVLGSSQEYPQRLDWARTMRSDFEAIQKEELEALAQTYLKTDALIRFRLLPKPTEPGTP